MERLLVKNVKIKGLDRDVLLEGEKILRIATAIAPEPGDRTLEGEGMLAIPGLVDCHAHIDKSHLNDGGRTRFVHGTGAVKGGLTREQKALFTQEDVTQRAEKVLQTALRSGTLHLRTNCDVDAIVGLTGIKALLDLREKYQDLLHLQIAAFAQEGVFQDGQTQSLLEEALRLGADLVGGHTITCGEGEKHIDFILSLAEKYGVEADFHLDESGNREHYLLPYLARRVKELGLQGRVNAIHMCTLSALTQPELEEALYLAADCGLKVTVAPTAISTRQIAPVKTLLEAGLPVGLGSDNIRDFFNPLGSGDIKQIALLLSYLQAFFTEEETEQIWTMLTDGGARVLGIPDYGLTEGGWADLTLFPAQDAREVLANQVQPRFIIRKGSLLNMGA